MSHGEALSALDSTQKCPVFNKATAQKTSTSSNQGRNKDELLDFMVNGGEGTINEKTPGYLIGEPSPGTQIPPQLDTAYKTDSILLDSRLSNIVISSSIPKDNNGYFWEYPSTQRFYNALKRKGFNYPPDQIKAIVSVHNTVNEKAWNEVLKYERYHKSECEQSILEKIQGKPGEYSVKSRIMNFIGYELPFDRHDWTVNRCGKRIDYIIDFYRGPTPLSIHIDARPKLTFEGFFDRINKFFDD